MMLLLMMMMMMCDATGAQPAQRAPQFMEAPAAMPGVPPGLEYLAQVDQLLVHQQIEIFERSYRSLLFCCCLCCT